MTVGGNLLSRRRVIATAGIGVGAGLLAGIEPQPAAAQSPADRHVAPAKPWSREYWAREGDVSLYMFRKRRAPPRKGETPLPALFLVHGSSISAPPSFDLTVPDRGDSSGALCAHAGVPHHAGA
jgi:hypothetical protein